MKRKKQFVTPRVLQEVPVQLERDLLQGSVQNELLLKSMGIGVDNYDFSEDIENNPYSIEWVVED